MEDDNEELRNKIKTLEETESTNLSAEMMSNETILNIKGVLITFLKKVPKLEENTEMLLEALFGMLHVTDQERDEIRVERDKLGVQEKKGKKTPKKGKKKGFFGF